MYLKKLLCELLSVVLPVLLLSACGNNNNTSSITEASGITETSENSNNISPEELSDKIMQLDNGLTAVKYNGDYKFKEFMESGGASSDKDVIKFISDNLISGTDNISFSGKNFGCSTISVKNTDGGYLFGRNFDFNHCNGMIVSTVPASGYASISTVNTDFISISGLNLSKMPDNVITHAGIYAPLDGMNEKGLCVSLNMIQDSESTSQNTDKPDITTTTAVRLLLDQAADTDEAIRLLEEHDFHTSMGMTVHFAIADSSGKSVCVEYIDDKMIVTETPVVTNFYFAEGDKNGIGTEQSHKRYDILTNIISESGSLDMDGVKNALDSVSKHNFNSYESTEWSVVFNQQTGEARYYHRENYNKCYKFQIEKGD